MLVSAQQFRSCTRCKFIRLFFPLLNRALRQVVFQHPPECHLPFARAFRAVEFQNPLNLFPVVLDAAYESLLCPFRAYVWRRGVADEGQQAKQNVRSWVAVAYLENTAALQRAL